MWARVELCYSGTSTLTLIYKDPVDEIDFYLGGVRWGSHRLLGTGSVAPHFWTIFDFTLHGCAHAYLRVKSGDVANFNFTVLSEQALASYEQVYTTFYGVFYSIMVLSFVVSILFWIRMRHAVFLCFASLIVFQDFLGASLLNGYLFRFVMSPDSFVRLDIGNIFAPLMNASLLAFALAFLTVPWGWARRLTQVMIVSQLLVVSPILLNLLVPIHTQNYLISQFVNQSIMVSCLWVIVLASFSPRDRQNRLFLLVSAPKAASQIVKTLLLQGDLHEGIRLFGHDLGFFVFNVAALGSLIEAVGLLIILINFYLEQMHKVAERLHRSELDAELLQTYKQVAHDIRSPLSALKIVADRAKTLPEAKLVGMAVERIEQIAEDLSGRRERLEKIDPSSAIERAIRELSVRVPGVTFRHDQDPRRVQIEVHASDFARTLTNLLNNSVEAGAREICVQTRVTDILLIQITDNGAGIAPEVLAKLGHERVTHGKERGSGLGFQSSADNVRAWGGHITVASQLGNGTTITVVLPLVRE